MMKRLIAKAGITMPPESDEPGRLKVVQQLIADFAETTDEIAACTAYINAVAAKQRGNGMAGDAGKEIAKDREFSRHPYLAKREDCRTVREHCFKRSKGDQQAMVAKQAEQNKISPEDCMALAYSIFGNEDSRLVQAFIWTQPWDLRVLAHNFYIAEAQEPTWWITWGEVLLRCPFPLFPMGAFKEFDKLNDRLLNHVHRHITVEKTSAGAGPTQQRPIPFPADVFCLSVNLDSSGGGYSVPVVNQSVDLSEVQHEFCTLQKQVQGLQYDLKVEQRRRREKEQPGGPGARGNPCRYCGLPFGKGHRCDRTNFAMLSAGGSPSQTPPAAATSTKVTPTVCNCGAKNGAKHTNTCPLF